MNKKDEKTVSPPSGASVVPGESSDTVKKEETASASQQNGPMISEQVEESKDDESPPSATTSDVSVNRLRDKSSDTVNDEEETNPSTISYPNEGSPPATSSDVSVNKLLVEFSDTVNDEEERNPYPSTISYGSPSATSSEVSVASYDDSSDSVNKEDETAPSASQSNDDAISEQLNVSKEDESSPSTFASSSSKVTANHPFGETFDEFLKKFLDTVPSQLDDHEIRSFMQKIPQTFLITEDRFQTVFKVLFKIKELPDKAVCNDTLALLEKCFKNFNSLDFNKFLVQFWNCDEIKDRELGPIGYSFTEGRARYNFEGVTSSNNDIVTINAKAVNAAWSMLLDVEATITSMLDTYMNDKPMSVFYLIILRRFKCLGECMVKIDGKETPIFMYFIRKVIDGLEGHRLNIALSCLVSVSWSPKGHYCWSLMKPNYALCEIMNHLVRDDEHHDSYMLALRRLFTPINGFACDIEWNADSKEFDNHHLFFFHFIKYYNRKQKVEKNNEIFFIFTRFKTSLRHFGNSIANFGVLEECVEVDWPFAYHVINYLNIQDIKRHLPESVYKALPEAEIGKYLSLDETSETSLQKALTGLVELYYLCNQVFRIPEFDFVFNCSYQIPDVLYKNLWNTHPHPKSVIDLFARSILQAYKNLRSSVNVVIDKRFVDFVSRVSQYCMDYDLVASFSSATELNFDFITRSNHLVVLGRACRLIIEDQHGKNGRKPVYRDLPDFFFDLFHFFAMKTRDKFSDIKTVNQGLWAPWRKGAAACMEDEKSMAINHFLNAIQKEAFCMFDGCFLPGPELLDFLFLLHKQRKFIGLTYPRVEEALRERYSGYFEESSHMNRGTPQRYQRNQPSPQDQDRGQPQNDDIQGAGYQAAQNGHGGGNRGPSNNGRRSPNNGRGGGNQDFGSSNNRRGNGQDRGLSYNGRGGGQNHGPSNNGRGGSSQEREPNNGHGGQDRGPSNGRNGGNQERGAPSGRNGGNQDRAANSGRGGSSQERGRNSGFGIHPITDNQRGGRIVRNSQAGGSGTSAA